MKIVTWTQLDVPEDMDFDASGNMVFEDHRFLYNLEIGDQIQYVFSDSGVGTRCFFVTEIFPFDDCDGSPTSRKMVVIEE
jgi:hypothetical protein